MRRRLGAAVVEEDVSRWLATCTSQMLAAMGWVDNVIYVGCFSKSIAPATRVGYVIGSEAFIEALASRKMALGLTTPELMERLVYEVVSGGRYQSHVTTIQTQLMQAHHRFYEQAEALGMEVRARPYAGLFAGARLARTAPAAALSTVQLAQHALPPGIWLAPGSYF